MKIITGNLLDLAEQGMFDIIVHGCNCMNVMGAGIAKEIKNRYPEAFWADKATPFRDIKKLGSFSVARARSPYNFYIVNAYTQTHFGTNASYVDYAAIRKVFSTIKMNYGGFRIGYPMLGCGLAGGNWNIVSDIINDCLTDSDHTLVILPTEINK